MGLKSGIRLKGIYMNLIPTRTWIVASQYSEGALTYISETHEACGPVCDILLTLDEERHILTRTGSKSIIYCLVAYSVMLSSET